MKLANRYSEEDKNRIWGSHPFCAKCGSNQMVSIHHVHGTSSDDIRKSIPLCHTHHKQFDSYNVVGGVKGKEMQQWALDYTAKWIKSVEDSTI